MDYLGSVAKLRRKLTTSNKSHAAFQEITICEDAQKKVCIINLLTPNQIAEDNVKKSIIKIVKETNCKQIDCKEIELKHETLSFVNYIEKRFDAMQIVNHKDTNCFDISTSLPKLAEIESYNDKNEL